MLLRLPAQAKIGTVAAEKGKIISKALNFTLGLALSQARLFGSASPFAAAFAASASAGSAIFAGAGLALGFLLRFDGAWTARQLAAVLAALAINCIVSRSGYVKGYLKVAPVNAGLSLLLTGITVLAAQGFDSSGLLIYACEAAIAAGTAPFFCLGFGAKKAILKREPLAQKQQTALTVMICAALISLEGFELSGISPARAAACFAVLCAAKLSGAAGGCVCGGAMGFAMSLGSRLPFLASGYSFSGLITGLLAPFGRLAQAVPFLLCNLVVVLVNTGSENLMPPLYEAVLAATAFLFLPDKLFEKAQCFFTARQSLPEPEMLKQKLLLRFRSVADGLNEVAEALEQIAQSLSKNEKSEVSNMSEIKHLVRDQFATLAMAVEDIADELSHETRFDTLTAARVAEVLGEYSVKPKSIVCSETAGVEKIEITAEKIRGKLSRAALMADMEAACGYKLNSPSIRESQRETRLVFVKKPKLKLRIGKAQFTANEAGYCGDSCDLFLDKDGNQIIVLSDGMGTGPRAAVDGAVAAWLFSKLLVAGLNFDSALRLSNSALIVKSEEETLATIDSAKINPHTGALEFFKAGAGNSLICKGNKLYKFGNPSMPLGILREIEFDKEKTVLSKGDVLLMMSDGVPTACYSLIADELRCFNKKDPTALAERVVEIAKNSSSKGHTDDITVIAVAVG